MAENFTNFLTSKTYQQNQTLDIVPKAGNSLSSNGIGSRQENTIAQLHSIYVTKKVTSNYTSNPLAQASYISLYIVDTLTNNKYYIANNVLVLPHSAFYIEKTITLLSQHKLVLEYTSLNSSNNSELSTVCSCIEIG